MSEFKHFVTSNSVEDFVESLQFACAINERLDCKKLISFFNLQEFQEVNNLKHNPIIYFYAVQKEDTQFKRISDNPETILGRNDCTTVMRLIIKMIDDFGVFWSNFEKNNETIISEKVKEYLARRRKNEEQKWGGGWNPISNETDKDLIQSDALKISILGELRDKLYEINKDYKSLENLEFITSLSYQK